MILLQNNYTANYSIYCFYQTTLSNYVLNTVDLDFNINLCSEKLSSCKGIGKTPKSSVVNYIRCKLKKRNNKLKHKTYSYENSKSL
ncbi:MAG: hypothetical protein H0W73_08675 [Bacteroidetes bacterium]|nr:hypothetical protein [Bacteroidota bacterium]